MSYALEYDFPVGTPVYIDKCENLVGYVTAIQWRHIALVNYEISWVTNGKAESGIIEGWRLTEAKA